jgi:hypothetical protein
MTDREYERYLNELNGGWDEIFDERRIEDIIVTKETRKRQRNYSYRRLPIDPEERECPPDLDLVSLTMAVAIGSMVNVFIKTCKRIRQERQG